MSNLRRDFLATKANINNNIELLKLYYDEWKYRLDNFRKHLLQTSIVIFLHPRYQ